MAWFKYTMGINGDDHGFKESWYCESAAEDIPPIFARFGPVRVARQQLLGKNWAIVNETVSLVQDNAGAKVVRVGQSNRIFLPGAATKAGSEPGTSLLCVAETSDGKFKKLSYLGGPWEEIFPGDGVYNPSPAGSSWLTRLNSYQAALVAADAGWKHQVPTDPKAKITGYTFNPATGNTTYTLDPATPWTGPLMEPVRVNVDFPTGRSSLDGVQIVVFTDVDSATTAKPRPARPFSIQGTMTFYTYTLKTLGVLNQAGNPGTFTGQGPVERKRGRPLLSSPGRAPARIRW